MEITTIYKLLKLKDITNVIKCPNNGLAWLGIESINLKTIKLNKFFWNIL
jgi:hypothetical protein